MTRIRRADGRGFIVFCSFPMDGYVPVVLPTPDEQGLIVFRMPREISQSRLGGRTEISSACTLITLKMAEILHRSATYLDMSQLKKKITDRLFQVLCEAIFSGNAAHEMAMSIRKEQYFTIPDGIIACGDVFREVDFAPVEGYIERVLPCYLNLVIDHPDLVMQDRLYFIMICCSRAVLITYERSSDLILLADTHFHEANTGAVLAVTKRKNIRSLVKFMTKVIYPECLQRRKQKFELSLLSFCGMISSTDCCTLTATIPPMQIFDGCKSLSSTKRKAPLSAKPQIVKRSRNGSTECVSD